MQGVSLLVGQANDEPARRLGPVRQEGAAAKENGLAGFSPPPMIGAPSPDQPRATRAGKSGKSCSAADSTTAASNLHDAQQISSPATRCSRWSTATRPATTPRRRSKPQRQHDFVAPSHGRRMSADISRRQQSFGERQPTFGYPIEIAIRRHALDAPPAVGQHRFHADCRRVVRRMNDDRACRRLAITDATRSHHRQPESTYYLCVPSALLTHRIFANGE